MVIERHSHRKFWAAIVVLAILAITFSVSAAYAVAELKGTQNSLLSVQSELEAAQTQLASTGGELETTRSYLEDTLAELNETKAQLLNLQVNYQRLTRGYGYVLRDPSYEEMKDFLARDRTSEREYQEGVYVCVDFAQDVKANAARERLRCAYVVIEYRGGTGHSIIAFDTTDRGLVFIEPQFDWEVEPEVGRRYYQCVNPPPGYHMVQPSYDDTIRRVIVIW